MTNKKMKIKKIETLEIQNLLTESSKEKNTTKSSINIDANKEDRDIRNSEATYPILEKNTTTKSINIEAMNYHQKIHLQVTNPLEKN